MTNDGTVTFGHCELTPIAYRIGDSPAVPGLLFHAKHDINHERDAVVICPVMPDDDAEAAYILDHCGCETNFTIIDGVYCLPDD